MEYRTLEINVISAKDLNKVNIMSKMDVYAVVSIDDGMKKSSQKKKTPVSHDGDTNPSWNCPMHFTIDESAARQNRLTLVFELRSERALGDRDIGDVRVPIKELIDAPASTDGKHQFVNYQVRKPSGKPKGQLSLSYKFGEKVAGPAVYKADEPVKAYPGGSSQSYPPQSAYPPPSTAAGSYPPPKYETPYPAAATGYPQGGAPGYPPQGYPQGGASGYPPQGYPQPQQAYGGYPPQGYPPPQQGGYGGGYPQAPGYGYQQQGVKPPKKNKMGMGLGAGLLGGALGGLLIGDMISDAGDYGGDYGGGYDGGFDDGGGFDF